MSGYHEQLLDPRWQRRRLEVLSEAGWHCWNCGDGEKTLHVHHLRYVKGRAPWEYPDDLLQVLCADCHKEWHARRAEVEDLLARVGDDTLVAGFLAGTLAARDHAEFFTVGFGEEWFCGFVGGWNASRHRRLPELTLEFLLALDVGSGDSLCGLVLIAATAAARGDA